jgi:hypothetical protein
MTRRKGEITSKRIDHEYPHQIEIPIPSGMAWAPGPHDMHEFCRSRGIQYATRGIGKLRREQERDAVRYCFRVADDAEEFQAMYGGEHVVLPAKKPAAESFGGRGLWSKRRREFKSLYRGPTRSSI